MRVNVRHVYAFAPDLAAMRHFYVELLGMVASAYRDGPDEAWLALRTEGFELVFLRGEPAGSPGFAFQPGSGSGEVGRVSWSIEVPTGSYVDTIERLREAEVKASTRAPALRNGAYWGWTVLDPAGHTVEVFTIPAEKPAPGVTWASWAGGRSG